MEQKSKNAISISIIGGADGPTSIFTAGHSKNQPLKIRIKNSIYRYKRKKVEKTIVANPHSLSETMNSSSGFLLRLECHLHYKTPPSSQIYLPIINKSTISVKCFLPFLLDFIRFSAILG